MERAEGYVWCDVHGSIHERTNDPYGYGDDEPECGVQDWRKLWIGAEETEDGK